VDKGRRLARDFRREADGRHVCFGGIADIRLVS